jgi:hypothetical protein
MCDQVARAVWQVGGGPTGRSYTDQFLQFGVALIGPGWPGAWNSQRSDDEFDGDGSVRRFASDPAIGDIVLLRSGQSVVHAIGLIASDYVYLPQFDDVNGWDLQHGRRVRWYTLPTPYNFGSAVFGANPRRFSRVGPGIVIDYARNFIRSPPTDWQSGPLPPLPAPEPDLLILPQTLSYIVPLAAELSVLYWDREEFGDRPSEDELLGHLVIPLLRAFGWAPEYIAVKWRDVDVCVFRRLPRIPENVHLVIEVKRLGDALEGALAQAQGYAAALGIICDLIVTDGLRYRLFEYDGRADFLPTAYANLTRLKQSAEKLFARMRRA